MEFKNRVGYRRNNETGEIGVSKRVDRQAGIASRMAPFRLVLFSIFRAFRWWPRFACVLVAWACVVGSAQAQDSSLSFIVKKFVIEGSNPLPRRVTDRILSPYENRPLGIEQLRTAATEIENELARNGYNFYRVVLPPQALSDAAVRLQIKRITIADVVVTGNRHFSSDNIKRSLPLVAPGSSPNTQAIANALVLAEDNPSKDVRVVFVKGDETQTIDANIAVKDQNPNQFYLWSNNAGSRLTTQSRIGVQYHHRNLWGRDHQLALSYTVSPEDTDELNQFGINYRLPVYSIRGMVNLFYSKSDADTGRVADVFDISGAGETVGAGYTHYFDKHGRYQHRLGVDVIDKLFDSDVLFAGTNLGQDVRSRPLIVEYISQLSRPNLTVNATASYAANLSGGSYNDDESYSANRSGADPDWRKQNLSARVDYRWNRGWLARFALYAQLSSDALIPGEQFGMGGALGNPGPRGFYEREVTMDKGVKASFELGRRFASKNMQLGVFYDYARGESNNTQVGESSEESLSSVGISYQWNARSDLSLTAEYGYVLDGIDQRFSTGTDDGDSRVHLSLRYFPAWFWGDS